MNIPIAKPVLGEMEKKAVWEVMESGELAQGSTVEEFEKKFSEFIGTKYAIATSNGTTALHISLLSLGIEPGEEVITTPFSFMATATSIIFTGAKPVFADIDPMTFNLDPESVKQMITTRTKAIMPVHLYGQSTDMDPLREIAEEHDIVILEDACQAHGEEYKGKKVGGIGDCAAFSFYPTKNMTTGEGGMITTNSREIAEEARLLRSHGQISRYEHAMVGYNFRMTNIHAAIGVVQLQKLPHFNSKRRENALYFTDHLEGADNIATPQVAPYAKHVFHQYTIRCKNRDGLKMFLNKKGIAAGVYYPDVLYNYPAIKSYFNGQRTESEKATREVLSLPVHPHLSDEEIEFIVNAVQDWSELQA